MRVTGLAALVGSAAGSAGEYAKFDLNGDGLIDPQEVRTVYSGSLSEEDLHDFWSSVDPKGRGVFTLEEYVDFVVRQGSTGQD